MDHASQGLRAAFLSALSDDARSAFATWDGLDGALRDVVEAGERALGGLTVAADALAAQLATCVRAPPDFAALVPEDVYLAAACRTAEPAAVARLEDRCFDAVDAVANKHPALGKDELRQLVRERLLVAGPGAQARIGEYRGRGPLRRWVRTIAERLAIDLARQAPPAAGQELDEIADMPAPSADPELALIRARYRTEFKAALREASARLEPRERAVLRLTAIQGLTGDDVAKLYQVHRVTVTRWLATARERLLQYTRASLAARLKLAPEELDSALRLAMSGLELSLSGALDSAR